MLLELDHLPGILSFSQGKQIINLHNYLPNFVMHLELYWKIGVRVKQSLPLKAIIAELSRAKRAAEHHG